MVSNNKRENQTMNEKKSNYYKEKEKQTINKKTSKAGSKTKSTYQIQCHTLQHNKTSPSNAFKFWSLRGEQKFPKESLKGSHNNEDNESKDGDFE